MKVTGKEYKAFLNDQNVWCEGAMVRAERIKVNGQEAGPVEVEQLDDAADIEILSGSIHDQNGRQITTLKRAIAKSLAGNPQPLSGLVVRRIGSERNVNRSVERIVIEVSGIEFSFTATFDGRLKIHSGDDDIYVRPGGAVNVVEIAGAMRPMERYIAVDRMTMRDAFKQVVEAEGLDLRDAKPFRWHETSDEVSDGDRTHQLKVVLDDKSNTVLKYTFLNGLYTGEGEECESITIDDCGKLHEAGFSEVVQSFERFDAVAFDLREETSIDGLTLESAFSQVVEVEKLDSAVSVPFRLMREHGCSNKVALLVAAKNNTDEIKQYDFVDGVYSGLEIDCEIITRDDVSALVRHGLKSVADTWVRAGFVTES
jgi:hypothetical protein